MLASPPVLLLALVLLAGPVLAQPVAASCRPGVRHLVVSAESPGEVHPICISPGRPTVFSFDTQLAPGSVTLEGSDGFTLVDPGGSLLKLVPSDKVRLGAPLRLMVRFADGAAPSSAVFMLVAHAAHAEPLVDVHRRTRTVDSYQQELRAKEEEARLCHEENARLRSDRESLGGLMGLLESGVMGEDGVASQNLRKDVTVPPTNPLWVASATGFRSAGRGALVLELDNPVGAPAWSTEGVALTLEGKRSTGLKVLRLWQEAPILPGKSGRVMVETESPPDNARGPYTVKLWEAGGTRAVTLGNVTFP